MVDFALKWEFRGTKIRSSYRGQVIRVARLCRNRGLCLIGPFWEFRDRPNEQAKPMPRKSFGMVDGLFGSIVRLSDSSNVE